MTILGLEEIAAVRSTLDQSEIGEINPDARASVAVNFDSELLPVARSGGVLLAGVTPKDGIISGTAAAMKMDGWTREDATLRDPAAITVVWPDLRIDRSPQAGRSVRLQEKSRDEALEKLKNAFREARAYARARAAEGQPNIPRHDTDPKLAALAPALDGTIPVVVSANRLAQIRDAVQWAKEENLRLVIWGGADAWRMAGELAQAGVPVIVESPHELPLREDDSYDAEFANAGKLAAAGVRVIFNEGGSDSSNVRNLPHLAATAVTFGFPRDAAVAAMTWSRRSSSRGGSRGLARGGQGRDLPRDRRGPSRPSLARGRRVPRRPRSRPDGQQKRLYERYRARPKARPGDESRQ